MKTIQRFCLTTFGTVVGWSLLAAASAQQPDLTGTWHCNGQAEDPEVGMSMIGEFRQTFDADGSYERTGRLRLQMAQMQLDTAISFEESGTWRAGSTQLMETMTEVAFELEAEAPTEMEQVVLQGIEAEAQDEISQEVTTEVTVLTDTSITLDEGSEFEMHCEKI